MAVNYNDRRFAEVEQEKQQALNNVNNTYNSMINSSDKFYQEQIDASKEYAETQKENQQAQTDFAIEKVEQQKEQAKQDYTKEQKASYVDWQKQSNQYGANAEVLASQGMSDTGYAESSQVSMYNQYQQRVATARETYTRAVLNYDNAIKDAQLQNNSALAEIAYNALQQQLELSLQGFQYKNNLLQTQLQMQQQTEDRYYQRWQNVLSQINTENALAEQARQFNEQMAFERQQAQQAQANWEKEYASAQKSATITKTGSGGSNSKVTIDKENGSSVTKPASAKVSSNSNNYTDVLNTTRRLYNATKGSSTPANARAFAEDYLSTAVGNGKISMAEAEKILGTIGLK